MENKQKYYPFTVLFLMNFAITFGFGISDTFFSYNFSGILGKGLFLSLAFTFYSVSKIFLMPIVGRLIDKLGSKTVLFGALSCYLAVSFIFVFSHNGILIIFARILQGAASALFRPVTYYMLGFFSKEGKIGKTAGYFDISFYFALASSPFVGGLILEKFGFEGLSVILLCVCIFVFILLLVMPMKITEEEEKTAENTENLGDSETLIFYALLLFIFFKAVCISVLNIYFPIYMKGLGFSVGKIGIAMGAVSAFMTFSLFFTGALADNSARRYLIAFGGFFSSIIFLFVPFETEFSRLLILTALTGAFSAVSQPAVSSILLEYSRSKNSAQTIAAFYTIMGIGFACGPLFAGLLYKYGGIETVLISTGFVGGIASLIFLTLAESAGKCSLSGQKKTLGSM